MSILNSYTVEKAIANFLNGIVLAYDRRTQAIQDLNNTLGRAADMIEESGVINKLVSK